MDEMAAAAAAGADSASPPSGACLRLLDDGGNQLDSPVERLYLFVGPAGKRRV